MSEFIPSNYGEKIGEGAEKVVFSHRQKPENVIGLFHEEVPNSPQLMKGRYYMQKLANIFMPEIFPDIHMVSSGSNTLERTRVNIDETKTREWDESEREKAAKKITEQAAEFGINLSDTFEGNFVLDTDSKIKYIDTLDPWLTSHKKEKFCIPYWSAETLIKSIEKLPPNSKSKALRYLGGLEKQRDQELLNPTNMDEEDDLEI